MSMWMLQGSQSRRSVTSENTSHTSKVWCHEMAELEAVAHNGTLPYA